MVAALCEPIAKSAGDEWLGASMERWLELEPAPEDTDGGGPSHRPAPMINLERLMDWRAVPPPDFAGRLLQPMLADHPGLVKVYFAESPSTPELRVALYVLRQPDSELSFHVAARALASDLVQLFESEEDWQPFVVSLSDALLDRFRKCGCAPAWDKSGLAGPTA